MAAPNTIQVFCKCGTKLGDFEAVVFGGGINMICPGCGGLMFISNNFINEVLDHPEQYEPNDRFTADNAWP